MISYIEAGHPITKRYAGTCLAKYASSPQTTQGEGAVVLSAETAQAAHQSLMACSQETRAEARKEPAQELEAHAARSNAASERTAWHAKKFKRRRLDRPLQKYWHVPAAPLAARTAQRYVSSRTCNQAQCHATRLAVLLHQDAS